MSLSQTLWQANLDLAEANVYNPFVQGLADGSLPRERFAYYVGQDAFFLESFARAYAVCAARAPHWRAFGEFHELAAGVLEELKLHGHYAETWGVNISEVQPGQTTRLYVDFLISTAWSRDLGETVCAMAPCMCVYAHVGQQLAVGGVPEHLYGDWIRTYSDPGFAALARQLEALVDRYATDTPANRAAYRYAMTCERDFFQAAWEHTEGT